MGSKRWINKKMLEGKEDSLLTVVFADGSSLDPRCFIFSHPFVKAVFGKNGYWVLKVPEDGQKYKNAWKHHLQQAVISEEPIFYYYDYVKNQ